MWGEFITSSNSSKHVAPKVPNTVAYFFFCLPFSFPLSADGGRQIPVLCQTLQLWPAGGGEKARGAGSGGVLLLLLPWGEVLPFLLAKSIFLWAPTVFPGWRLHFNPLILLGKGFWPHHLKSYYLKTTAFSSDTFLFPPSHPNPANSIPKPSSVWTCPWSIRPEVNLSPDSLTASYLFSQAHFLLLLHSSLQSAATGLFLKIQTWSCRHMLSMNSCCPQHRVQTP